MAEPFLSLDAGERADVLRTVAARSGRAAIILEKDIWVCWVLQAVFSMPDAYPMAFKGGTSLSKVYRIIDRFSEDVDVTLDYKGFNDGFDPFRTAPAGTRSGSSATAQGPGRGLHPRRRGAGPRRRRRPPLGLMAGTPSASATTARRSVSPIRPRSKTRGVMSGVKSCWNSADAT